MFNIELFYVGEKLNSMLENNPKLQICEDILKDLNLKIYSFSCDKDRVMELSKGKADPVNGFAFIIRPETDLNISPRDEGIILDYFELVKFFDARNYRHIINL